MVVKTLARVAICLSLIVPVTACSSGTPALSPQPVVADATDRAFVPGATMASNGEIGDAKIAVATSQNPDVVAFAQKMITDHTGENTAMTPVAATVSVPVPTGVTPAMQAITAQLMTLTGTTFDAAYINSEIAGHQMNLANNYAPELQLGVNPTVLGYAKTYQPQVQSHLALATSIKTKYNF